MAGCPMRGRDLREALDEVLALHRLAENMLVPPVAEFVGNRPPESRPPLHLPALDLDCGYGTLAVLEPWEVLWRHVFGLTPYGVMSSYRRGDPLAGVVEFLSAWADEAVDVPAAEFPRCLSGARALVRSARADLGLVEDEGWAECPCGGKILLDGTATCRSCGVHWNLARLLGVAEGPVWVNAPVAQWLLGGRLGPLVRDGAVVKRGSGPLAMYNLNP